MRIRGVTVLAIAVTALVTACGGLPFGTRTVPGFVGEGLNSARKDAESHGFYNLSSHDATGQGRVQILDHDWRVCFQTPVAGRTVSTSTKIDLGVVKLNEACPATEPTPQVAPTPVLKGQAMTDLTGKSLDAAAASLPSGTRITANDVSGRDRVVIIRSHWKVCSQNLKAGTPFTGQPVTFGVVKLGEPCP